MSAITLQTPSLDSSPKTIRSITQQPGTPITREFSRVPLKEQDEYFKYSKYNGKKMKTQGGKLKRKTRKHRKSKRKHRKSKSYKK